MERERERERSYNFPHHIVPTDPQPNLVWWNDSQQGIFFAELAISFETSYSIAAERKSSKYESLIVRAKENGYIATFIPIQVGSRDIIDESSFITKSLEFQSGPFLLCSRELPLQLSRAHMKSGIKEIHYCTPHQYTSKFYKLKGRGTN